MIEGESPCWPVCDCHSDPPMLFCCEPCLELHQNGAQAEARTPRVAHYELGRRRANAGVVLLMECVLCRREDQKVAGDVWQRELEQCTDGIINEEHPTDRVLLSSAWALIKNARYNSPALRKIRKQVRLLLADAQAEIVTIRKDLSLIHI